MLNRNTILADGWSFARGSSETPTQAFRAVCIPHDWAIENAVPTYQPAGESQGFFNDRGIGWYKTCFPLDKQPAKRYYLDFDGVMEDSTVWVNDVEVGGHGWGYTPFRLDVTEAVCSGENRLVVRADCSHTPPDRWYSGCGLYRPVTLICVPKIHLDERDVVVTTAFDGDTAIVHVVTGVPVPVQAMLTLQGNTAVQGEGCGELTLTVPQPQRWSAETPTLYTLTLALADGSDCVELRIGLREVRYDVNGITVNGHKTYLRGVCVHQDVAGVGIATTPSLWRKRLVQLKEMGCNAIRGAHHVHSAAFMDLCDEMGFYVYEEFTDKWHSGSYNRYFDNWQSDVDAMLRRDRNRPSVVIWGCGNEVENQAQPSMISTLQMLTDYIRKHEPTRPVSYAMNPHFKRRSGIDASKVANIQVFVDEADEYEIEDLDERVACIARIAEHVDIVSCNYQEQWFEAIHKVIPDKPILATEVYQFFIGHEKNMQNFSMGDIPVAFGEKCPYCLGSFIWAGYDYLGESHGWPGKGSTSGVIRSNGYPRATAHILRSLWRKEPYIHLGVLDYSFPDEITKEHWAIPPYEDGWDFKNVGRQVFPFLIATNCEEVMLEYADRKLWFNVRSDGPSGYITGFVPFVVGVVRVTGYIGGEAVCTHELHTPGATAALSFVDAPETLPAHAGDQHQLMIKAMDAAGIHVIRALDETSITVEGPAQLVAVDNGDSLCLKPFSATTVPLYRGAISAIIRLSGEPGTVTVHARTAPGCEGCTVIQVQQSF